MQAASVKHLLFYDGTCGLCDHAVQFVLKRDKNALFLFAPLQGTTAKKWIQQPLGEDSLLLIENMNAPNEKRLLLAQGAFRILWLLGGIWALPGLLSFLPGFLFNWAYRLVAKNRHRLFSKEVCILPDPAQRARFLE